MAKECSMCHACAVLPSKARSFTTTFLAFDITGYDAAKHFTNLLG
jgi:hypothetical protein